MRWTWESEPAPKSSEVIRHSLLRHISFDQPRSVPDLHHMVMEDVGLITERSIYRHIKLLVEGGVIRVVSNDDTYGYVQVGHRRCADPEVFVDQAA